MHMCFTYHYIAYISKSLTLDAQLAFPDSLKRHLISRILMDPLAEGFQGST